MEKNKEENVGRQIARLRLAKADIQLAHTCALHIRKKDYHRKKRVVDDAYIDQIAYTTTLVISYGRIFTESKNWVWVPVDPKTIYSCNQHELHTKFLDDERDKFYAHSDGEKYNSGKIQEELPAFVISRDQIEMFLEMCNKLEQAIVEKMNALEHQTGSFDSVVSD